MAAHSSVLAWRIPMDRGAWWATVMGSQSQTRLSDYTAAAAVGAVGIWRLLRSNRVEGDCVSVYPLVLDFPLKLLDSCNFLEEKGTWPVAASIGGSVWATQPSMWSLLLLLFKKVFHGHFYCYLIFFFFLPCCEACAWGLLGMWSLSSLTWDQTCTPAVEVSRPNHCSARAVSSLTLLSCESRCHCYCVFCIPGTLTLGCKNYYPHFSGDQEWSPQRLGGYLRPHSFWDGVTASIHLRYFFVNILLLYFSKWLPLLITCFP